jgi:hypothetical protein
MQIDWSTIATSGMPFNQIFARITAIPCAPSMARSGSRCYLAQHAPPLAAQGVFVGASSWKYPGWCGFIYDRDRYEYRGKFAETRFQRDCLREYAEVFKAVCVGAADDTLHTQQHLEATVSQTPDDFRFGLKVTDAITIKKFPQLDRFGGRWSKTQPYVCSGTGHAGSLTELCSFSLRFQQLRHRGLQLLVPPPRHDIRLISHLDIRLQLIVLAELAVRRAPATHRNTEDQ